MSTCLKFPLDKKLSLPADPASFLCCTWLDNDNINTCDSEHSFCPPLSISSIKYAKVHSVTLLTKGDDVKKKIEVLVDPKNFDCSYVPGDTIGIFPNNYSLEVETLINKLDLKDKASKPFKVEILSGTTKKNAAVPNYIPTITTAKHLFSKCLEIRAPIKKLFLKSLCKHTQDETERRRLEELCSKEGIEGYNKYILSENLNILSILELFKTCRPPLSLLLEQLPCIKSRVYSIASSPLVNSEHLRIVVTVVEKDNRFKGVCSGLLYGIISKSDSIEDKLRNLQLSDEQNLKQAEIPMFFRQPNNFRFPENRSFNHILIGPGSGVAPFIGFLEHKQALSAEDSSSHSQTWLFFGCRNEDDFIYRNEINEFLNAGILTKLFVSFSRPSQPSDSPKYVQDSILQIKEEFTNLLTCKETLVYICGDAQNMVKDVLHTIELCLQQVRGIDENDAINQVKEFSKCGKIICDSWI